MRSSVKKFIITSILIVTLSIVILALSYKSVIAYAVSWKAAQMGIPLELEIEKVDVHKLHLVNIKIGEHSEIEFVKLGYDLKPEFTLKSFSIDVTRYDLDELKGMAPPSEGTQSKFEHCEKIKDLDLNIRIPDFDQLDLELECNENQISAKLNNFKYLDLGPFHLDTKTNINEDPISSEFKVAIGDSVSPIAEGTTTYSLSDGEVQIEIKKRKKSLELTKLIEHLAPGEIKEQILSTNGRIRFHGKVKSAANILGLDLKLLADNINVETKDYQVKGARLRHSLIEYPSMKSKKRQSFQAKEITVGPTIHDFSIVYEIESTEKIIVNEFKAKYEGASIKTNSFSIFPNKKRISPAEINVENLDLEKFLKLALGDTATATGKLTGELKIRFKNNMPIIEKGLLKAKGPGTIQYRPPTSNGPPDPNSFSADPMVILNSYLYDFHYKTLRVTMSSDENYDMKMTMTALGKNPGYLNGKALKLNVNLEQNLLAAFQAMMLSYNLPKRLEEKITNLGKSK